MQDAGLTIRFNRPANVGAFAATVARLTLIAAVSFTAAAAAKQAPAPQAAARKPAGTSSVLPNSEITVRLYPTAVVTGEQVLLSDVAEVQGEAADLVARWPVTMAPQADATVTVESSVIQSMLARRGINLGHWVFRGATRCVVSRPGDAKPTQSSRIARGAGEEKGASNAAPTATRPGEELNAAKVSEAGTLEAVLREHVARRVASLGGTPIVRFSPAVARILALSRPTFDFRIADRSERLLGMVSLEVTILENDRPRQTVPVLADVSLKKQVVVATRPINRGEIINSGSLDLEERVFERAEDVTAGEVNGLVGQRAKRFIDAHGTLTTKDIEPVPMVIRNDLITVLVHRGALTIRGSAKAMATGSLGDTVLLKNEGSKETFSAVVTGPKQAEVGGVKAASAEEVAAAR